MKNFCYLAGMFVVTQVMFGSCCNDKDGLMEERGPVMIFFEAQFATVTNPYEGKGINITVEGANVVIRSEVRNEVTYILSGSTANGALKIYSEVGLELKMNGVYIMNPGDPALNIQTGKKTTVTLADGTSNSLVGGRTFRSEGGNEDVKAAFFSEGQLIFTGNGSLTVAAPYRHAVCSDDHIQVDGGVITVSEAERDGFHANDYIEINGGTIDITSVGDGIDSEGYVTLAGGSLKITTTGRKGHGVKSVAATTVNTAETIDIKVEGAASKAFNCGGDMLVSQGNIHLVTSGSAFYDAEEADISSAAGIKCDGSFVFNGGDLLINSSGSGGKGINAGGNMNLEGGQITVVTTGEVFRYGEEDSAAKAVKCDSEVMIGDCSLTISTSGRKAEGLESEAGVTILSGIVEVEAYDDAIKAAKSITINGGNVYGYSKTKGGIYSKGALNIAGGTVAAVAGSGSERGFDCGGMFKITGGTLLGIGGGMSIPTSNVCTQYSVLYSSDRSFAQHSLLEVHSSGGENIMAYQFPYAFSGMVLLFSSPELKHNAAYTLLSEGSPLSTFTVSSMVTDLTSQKTTTHHEN